MMFVKHFDLYLPTGWRVSKNSVISSSVMLYDMMLFTVEHKQFRIRHNFTYVKM